MALTVLKMCFAGEPSTASLFKISILLSDDMLAVGTVRVVIAPGLARCIDGTGGVEFKGRKRLDGR